MELKCGTAMLCLNRYARSNRTFMELKFTTLAINTCGTTCSNRTFMELKSERKFRPFLEFSF